MFNRRFLAMSAASAVLAASGVLGTAMVASAATPPMTVGPMQPAPGSKAMGTGAACGISGIPLLCEIGSDANGAGQP